MMIVSKQHQIFFDFLRFSIGPKSEIPSSLKEADWKELYAIAKKQCLVGVLFDGIKKLPAEHVGMKKELLLQWMAESQMLEKANVRLNDAAIQVSEWFRKKGFRTCILKGQGNALMYPNPYSRTPGDIDIWVEGEDKWVISFVHSISPHEKACYHHIEFPSYKGVEVEVHYRPSFLLCFWHNRKLQKYYERVKEEQFSHRVMLGEQGEIAIPTAEFNLIFQLTHIFSHLMNEGIGLRQLLDYYYVLCDFYKVYQKSSKITPSLFFDKASCTRQFESQLSLHSLASLFPIKEGIFLPLRLSCKERLFSKTYPSFLTFKEGSTSHLGLLPSGKKKETALLGARNRYAIRLTGHQSPRQIVRDGTAWV